MYNRLTKNDVKRIEEEIEHRKVVLRKELIDAVKEARAQGDLSENFEYYAAKRAKNQNEGRIRYLERMLKTAEIVEESSEENVVGMNNRVELYFEEDDETEVYKIVTPVRCDTLNNKISIESPIGKAVFGKKLGERVMVKVNDDYNFPVVIRAIDATGTDEDDEIRKY
ncbi:MAG: transcription elongation factor GreA [Lachnospiraceae bacterium]|nr:transcription elongation factor GreA [Lachnospiraceae bacterium]